MEVAISHRNQNSTSPHAVGAASLILGGWVRIDGRRGLNGGCFPSARYGCFFPAQQHRNESNRPKQGRQRGGSGGTHLQWTKWNRRQHPSSFLQWQKPRVAPSPIRPEPVEACPEGTRRACTEGHTKEASRAPFHRDRKVPRQHPPRRQSLRKQRVVVIVQGSAVRAGSGGRRVTPRSAPMRAL